MASAELIIEQSLEEITPVITIVPTTPSHIAELKSNLRPEDADEILRFGVTIQRALWYSYKHSLIKKTALIDGKVAACWGVTGTFMGKNGVPWLMTTSEVKRVSPLKFVRIYQEEVHSMLKLFTGLENYVDAEYSSAIRLLEIIGFTLEEPQKVGTGMYCKFWMMT